MAPDKMLPSKLGMGNFSRLPSWAAGALSMASNYRQADRQGPLGRLHAGIWG